MTHFQVRTSNDPPHEKMDRTLILHISCQCPCPNERQTGNVIPLYLPKNFVCGGIKMMSIKSDKTLKTLLMSFQILNDFRHNFSVYTMLSKVFLHVCKNDMPDFAKEKLMCLWIRRKANVVWISSELIFIFAFFI